MNLKIQNEIYACAAALKQEALGPGSMSRYIFRVPPGLCDTGMEGAIGKTASQEPLCQEKKF